jgi:hypothetical protein
MCYTHFILAGRRKTMDTRDGIHIFSDEYLKDEVVEKIKRHADHFLESSCDIERARDLMDNMFNSGKAY